MAMSNNSVQNMSLPKGWWNIKLGDVGKFSKGNGITKNEVITEGVPCVRYGELYTKHNFRINDFYSFISDKIPGKYKLIKYNDLLFAGSGETREEIGKCASFHHNVKAYAGGDVIICSIDPKILRADFASYYLNTIGRRQLNKLGQGDSIVHIYSRYLENVEIPVPPLPEQKAIASLFETWDTAIEKTEALVSAKQKRFEWLLSALIGQRQSSANWDKSKLVEVGRFTKGNGITKEDLAAEGIPCIRYGELYTRHNFRIQNFCSFISHKNAGRYKLIENNDLLFAGSGETREEIGKCASFNHNIEARAGGDVIICSIDPRKLRADFASYFLNTRGRRQLSKLGQGNSIVHIYSRFLESVEVPIPPLHEQAAITSLLKTCETEINKMEEIAEKYRTQKRGLIQKLLSGKWRVFSKISP